MIHTPLKVKDFFRNLNKNTMHLVDEFYDKNIFFRDPIVEIKGRERLKDYYTNLYKNVEAVAWHIPDEMNDQDRCMITWTMTLKIKNFNGNKPLVVEGNSLIKFGGNEDKAIYHRDYFDMGAFVYEGLPILGPMVRFVKVKMAEHSRNVK